MEDWKAYLRKYRLHVLVYGLFTLIFISIFALYHIPVQAVIYPALLCALLGAGILIFKSREARQRHRRMEELLRLPASLMDSFPEARTWIEADYQQLAEKLRTERKQLEDTMNQRFSDMLDYYTIWAHQIKTPIASMRLNLQNEDTELSRELSEDVFRIEQYVEMVLCYLRLGSDTSDYVIREQELDPIVRQAVRKYANQFIRRRIRLEYKTLDRKVITDEKWLQFVIEQVLSNALKYTPADGIITIFLQAGDTLCIQDTGIGIAPEDLPRIFEKGYTGYNGRQDKKASGIGLFLCRRICQNLGYTITAQSSSGEGTTMAICLDQNKLEVE